MNKRLAYVLAASFLLSGCAKPSLENYVFKKHGPWAKVIDGPESLPTKRLSVVLNDYKGAVGSITAPVVVSPTDIFNQKAAVWNIDRRCAHTAFNVHQLKSSPVEPGSIVYVMNLSNSKFPSAATLTRSDFDRDFPNLPKQFIGYLDYVVVLVGNGTSYLANDRQLDGALVNIQDRYSAFKAGRFRGGDCEVLTASIGKFQVAGMFTADFNIDIGFSAGFDISLSKKEKDIIRATLIRSYRYRQSSARRIYAMFARFIW